MPRKHLMTWEGHPHYRWRKMYKGTRYSVLCSELGIPSTQWTKDDSYQAANQWWTAKKLELDAGNLEHQKAIEAHDYPEVPELRQRVEYLKRHGEDDKADVIEAEIVSIKSNPPGIGSPLSVDVQSRIQTFQLLTGISLDGVDPHVLESLLNPSNAVWADRLKREKVTPPDRTIGAWADRFMIRKKEMVEDGKIGVHGQVQSDYRLRMFIDQVGRNSEVSAITSAVLERFRDKLAGSVKIRDGKGSEYAKNQWQTTREFVQWLYSEHALEQLPRNFNTLKLNVGGSGGDIQTFNKDEIIQIWNTVKGQQRLHILLGLNCGFYPYDISLLKKENVNLAKRTLVHKRSKTKSKSSAPTVTYKLWDETVELLEKYKSNHAEFFLTNAANSQWVRFTPKSGGGYKECDSIQQWWQAAVKKTGIKKPFKTLRKTGATRLNDSPHAGSVSYYLAHTPKTVAGKHYAKGSDRLLGEALEWLRLDLGIDQLPT